MLRRFRPLLSANAFATFTLGISLAVTGCGKSFIEKSNAEYVVLIIDARDGIDDEEIEKYHDIGEDIEVLRRIVKLYYDPVVDITSIGQLDLRKHNRLKVIHERVEIYVYRNDSYKGMRSFNNLLLPDTVKIVFQDTFWR